MPPALKAATGVDALTHAIEGYITRGAWALTDALHIKAIEIIAGALRGSVAGDKDAGEEMALGQYVAGMGFSNVGLGLVHGLSLIHISSKDHWCQVLFSIAISLALGVEARATIFPCRLTAMALTLVAPQSSTRITSCFIIAPAI